MGNQKRSNKASKLQPRDDRLNPLPGVTGEGAEKTIFSPTGGQTGGLMSDPGDGTLGGVSDELRQPTERALGDPYTEAGEQRGSRIDRANAGSGEQAGTNSDIAGSSKRGQSAYVSGTGADDVGGMGTGTGRGRGSEIAGGVAGSGDSAGAGDMAGGLTGGTGSQGLPRRGDLAGTGGGVAVSAGRGSDTGTVGGGMVPDLSPAAGGGMSGGTMGGSRESDLGGGLSGGMRSGMGTDVSGGIGDSDDETPEGDQQRNPRRRAKH